MLAKIKELLCKLDGHVRSSNYQTNEVYCERCGKYLGKVW